MPTSRYFLRSATRSRDRDEKCRMDRYSAGIPSRSRIPWIFGRDFFSMVNHDPLTICFQQKEKEEEKNTSFHPSPSSSSCSNRDRRKRREVLWEWTHSKRDKQTSLLRWMQDRVNREQCRSDLRLRFPQREGGFSSSSSSFLKFASRVQCIHSRYRIQFCIDALVRRDVVHSELCIINDSDPLSSSSYPFCLVGIRTTKSPWDEYHELKYQTLLKYHSCFGNLWSPQGYWVVALDGKKSGDRDEWSWSFHPRQEDKYRFVIPRMIRGIRHLKRHASFFLEESDFDISTVVLPNMKLSRDLFYDEKWKKAEKWGELSLLWGISQRIRQELWNRNVFSWLDPTFDVHRSLSTLVPLWKQEVIHRIVSVNRQSEVFQEIDASFFSSEDRERLMDTSWNHVFLDFEYTETGFVYLTGIVSHPKMETRGATTTMERSKMFWADHVREEETVLQRVAQWFVDHAPVRVWYWHIDESVWKRKLAQYPSISRILESSTSSSTPVVVDWRDLCSISRRYVAWKGVFDFSLKSIARGFHRQGLLPLSYEQMEISSGESSLIKFHKYQKDHLPFWKDHLLFYNYFDCLVVCKVFDSLTRLSSSSCTISSFQTENVTTFDSPTSSYSKDDPSPIDYRTTTTDTNNIIVIPNQRG